MDKINNKLLQIATSGKFLNSLRKFIITLLVVVIGWQLARMTILLLPKATTLGRWQPPPTGSQPVHLNQTIDLTLIKRANLFGEAKQSEVISQQITNAPVTRLKLKLTGVVTSSDPKTAAAIIESSGKQATYGIDERIDGTQATLKQVEADRVVIANRGLLETLLLDDVADQQHSKPTKNHSNSSRKEPKASKKHVANMLKEAGIERNASEDQLMAKLTDLVKVSPVREAGNLVGFRVKPGKNRKLFDAIGLKSNDLAVALNGIDLTDMIQATLAVQELSAQTEVMITVKRGEELHNFLLELPSE